MRYIFLLLIFATSILAHDLVLKMDSKAVNVQSLKVAGVTFSIKPLLKNQRQNNWFIATANRQSDISAWDLAHRITKENDSVIYAEPENPQVKYFGPKNNQETRGYNQDWGHPKDNTFAWHLKDKFSQLGNGKKGNYKGGARIRVAHFDTGYDPSHISTPKFLAADLQKNFIKGESENSAVDPNKKELFTQPGHGTGTLGILAGNMIKRPDNNFEDYVGGAPMVEIVPVRLDKRVVLIQVSSFAKALYYAVEKNCDVLSMSMGGVASKLWAEAVNDAYDNGLTMVTAAGNHFADLPTRYLVYPARFKRVIAACGVTYNNTPYYKKGSTIMQGCFGPPNVMKYAMAAYTPNIPWAKIGKTDQFGLSGGGTSAATPQIAATAALWLQKYNNQQYQHPWQKVNAVRNALFSSARKDLKESTKYYGNGVLQATKSLTVKPKLDTQALPKDKVEFPFLTLLLGWDDKRNTLKNRELFEVELLQLEYNNKNLQDMFAGLKGKTKLSKEERAQIKKAIMDIPETSKALSGLLQR